jgi:hypothetical protein
MQYKVGVFYQNQTAKTRLLEVLLLDFFCKKAILGGK